MEDHPRPSCRAEEVVYAPVYRKPQAHLRHRPQLAHHAKDIRPTPRPRASPAASSRWRIPLSGYGDRHSCLPKLWEAQKTTRRRSSAFFMGRDTAASFPRRSGESAIVGYTSILVMTRGIHPQGQRLRARQSPRSVHRPRTSRRSSPSAPPLVTRRRGARTSSKLRGPERPQRRRSTRRDHRQISCRTFRPRLVINFPCHSSSRAGTRRDVLSSTGTPRAFHHFRTATLRVPDRRPDGFEMEPLKNPVVDSHARLH